MFVRSVASTSRIIPRIPICAACVPHLHQQPLGRPRPLQKRRYASSQSRSIPTYLSTLTFFTPHHLPSPSISPPRWKTLLGATPIIGTLEVATESEPNIVFGTLADLLLASPIPSYGLTIMLLTLALRSSSAYAFKSWQAKRDKRLKEIVEPLGSEYRKAVRLELVEESRRAGLSYEEFSAKVGQKVSMFLAGLHKKYNTNPRLTKYAPLLVNFPLFLLVSFTIRTALEVPGNPLGPSSFLWIEKLSEPEFALALAGGLMIFSNVEITNRVRDKAMEKMRKQEEAVDGQLMAARAARQAKSGSGAAAGKPSPTVVVEASTVKPTATPRPQTSPAQPPRPPPRSPTPAGVRSPKLSTTPPRRPSTTSSASDVNPRRSISGTTTLLANRPTSTPSPDTPPDKTSVKRKPLTPTMQAEMVSGTFLFLLRLSSVGFVCIASQVPSGLTLYWVSSIGFTLAQSIYLNIYKASDREVNISSGNA